jgi:hypothetical protein
MTLLNAVQYTGIIGSQNDTSPVEPVKEPNSPKTLVATAGNAQVVLTWSPPQNDGGASITNYSVYRGRLEQETRLVIVARSDLY